MKIIAMNKKIFRLFKYFTGMNGIIMMNDDVMTQEEKIVKGSS